MKQYNPRSQRPRKKSLSAAHRLAILARDGNECAYCHYPADQVDHIIPWTYGGGDDDDNLISCCGICNLIASNKVFDNFAAKREFIRSRYGPYLEGRARRARRKLSFCPDCRSVFQPNVRGASAVLCSGCYRIAQKR